MKTYCLYVTREIQDQIWAKIFCISKNMHSRTPMDLVFLKLSTFCKLNLLIENIGSSWTSNVMIRSLLSLYVRNDCDMEIATLCTICSCWTYFEAGKGLLLPMKTKFINTLNVESDLFCTLSCTEPQIYMLSNNTGSAFALIVVHVLL